jgi:hypothetical protein
VKKWTQHGTVIISWNENVELNGITSEIVLNNTFWNIFNAYKEITTPSAYCRRIS